MSTQDTPNVPPAAAPAPRRAPVAKPAAAKPLAAQPATPKAVAAAVPAEPAPQAEEVPAAPVDHRGSFLNHPLIQRSSACLFSMAVHFVGLFLLAMITLVVAEDEVREIFSPLVEEEELEQEELMEVVLEENLDPAEEFTTAVVSSAPAAGAAGVGSPISAPTVAQTVTDNAFDQVNPTVNTPTIGIPSSMQIISEVPEGTLGEERAIVNDYNEAFDRITQEIMWMLEKSPVLVIWCFDQSESMKDDQAEIRSRIERVYKELGLTNKASGGALTTAVTSYGAKYIRHTEQPTSDLGEIRGAMTAVPIDPSGEEMMCEAVGRSIYDFRQHARNRQMALILVTDESGNRKNNAQYLEKAISEAKDAKCKIYTLGREAVFGYPYAHIRWRHPQTKRWHWLRIDRGPETAFFEQLQTNGFWRRHDAFDSGFGPYEQTRMSKETGGIFFMLPSVEVNLVQGADRKYNLEALRPYKPDLRERRLQLAERDETPIRAALWQVVNTDLNPYNPESAKVIVLRQAYSLNLAEFTRQARIEQQKCLVYLNYLARVEKFMEDNKRLREQETVPRWQGNYDLIYAQIVAFQIRVYEYARYLDYFIANPMPVPPPRKARDGTWNEKPIHWDIATRPYTFAQDQSQEYQNREKVLEYIEKANGLFEVVIQNHPGTPWAERARWEMRRGYGVHVVPDFEPIFKGGGGGPGKPPIPIPKF